MATVLRCLLPVVFLLLSAAGCVERRIHIATVPADADLYLDGKRIGTSPLTIPFSFYGTREIVVRKAGYRTVREKKVLEPPSFQEFPWDFYYETMTSDVYTDERWFSFVLHPVDASDISREVVDQKLREAQELRDR